MSMNMRYELIRAAEIACTVIKEDFQVAVNNLGASIDIKPSKNGLPDFVTETDRRAEKSIQESLSNAFPNVPFVGEESGGSLSQSQFFLVDPLDGTSNFAALRDYLGFLLPTLKGILYKLR